MTVFRRLQTFAEGGNSIRVAVVGAGFVGRALVHQINLTPAMEPSLLISRKPEAGVEAFTKAGFAGSEVLVSDDPSDLDEAIGAGRRCVSPAPWVLEDLHTIDVAVEATGDVEHGALVALAALSGGIHVVSLNYETDATVGPLLAHFARRQGVVYTGSDGDQPGVMMRLVEYARGIGLEVTAAVNCKGFLDVHATPETIAPWSERQGTSLKMTTAFTDGTKMNVENCCVANATGLAVDRRGMIGVETTLDRALEDFADAMGQPGIVDYTLGGDFGSGVFVIATGAHPELAAPYLQYLKMGPGPDYLFFRPWHLVQLETPLSIAEAVLDRGPTIAPSGGPRARVVTITKRHLEAGHQLDDIGGFDHYGEVDNFDQTEGLLQVGVAAGAVLRREVQIDQPLSLDDVELDESRPILKLLAAQAMIFDSPDLPHPELASVWNSVHP
ncbi:MAG: NAD(P)H-dependent oxidoreductase [Acidimicrobiia bacterium]